VLACIGSAWGQVGPSIRGAESISLQAVARHRAFRILLPSGSIAHPKPTRVLTAWVERDSSETVRERMVNDRMVRLQPLPSRKAVCLFYKFGNAGLIAVVQAKSLRGLRAMYNLGPIVGEGYFFRDLKDGSQQRHGTRAGTDFGVVGVGLSSKELDRFVATLRAANVRPGAPPAHAVRAK
jgi:hypothetical protein